MSKEIILKHEDLRDPQTITQKNIEAFKAADLDIHRHEVEDLEDDHKKGVRRLRIKNTKYFFMGGK